MSETTLSLDILPADALSDFENLTTKTLPYLGIHDLTVPLEPYPENARLDPIRFMQVDYAAKKHGAELLRFARMKMGPTLPTKPEDVVQQALMALAERKTTPLFRPDPKHGGMLPFFYGILRHKISDAFRQVRRLPQTIDDIPEQRLERYLYQGDNQWQLGDALELFELQTVLESYIAAMPETWAQAMRLRLFDHLPYQEIGEVLHIKEGTARLRVHRGRGWLRRALSREAEGSGHLLDVYLNGYENPEGASKTAAKPTPHGDTRVTPWDLRHKILEQVASYRAAGERDAALQIPYYIGQWAVIAKDLQTSLINGQPNSSALILYPHEHLLDQLRRYIGQLSHLSVHSLASRQYAKDSHVVVIDTPAQVEAQLPSLRFDYVAGPVEISAAIYERLRADAMFLLRLVGPDYGGLSNNLCAAPLYTAIGKDKIAWEKPDSLRYLTEWLLTTGQSLTAATADELAEAGQGPTRRRLGRVWGGFANLLAAAPYSADASPGLT